MNQPDPAEYEKFKVAKRLRDILSFPPQQWTAGDHDFLAQLAKDSQAQLANPLLIKICGSIHPIEVEWHCQCREDPRHKDNHRCYGCGFEWEQGNPHSRMPGEEADIAADVATAESMYRPNGQWRHA